MSGKLDLTVLQGETFARTITIKDNTGTPIDITLDSFRGQIRKRYSSTTTEADFDFTIVDGLNGIVSINLTAAEAEVIGTGKFVYDVEWIKADGTVTRILEGIADCKAEVTR